MHRAFTFFLALAVLALAATAHAQPAPSFQARCGELRASMAGLNGREEDELIAIEVVGPLAFIRDAGGIVYLGLCGPPDPRVLCVTYETNGRKLGDRVVVTGSILRAGPISCSSIPACTTSRRRTTRIERLVATSGAATT